MAYEFGNPEVIEEEVDILIIGGGMAACGTAVEIMRWAEGTGLKIKLVDRNEKKGTLSFELDGVDAAYANTLRRLLMTEVPVLAIEDHRSDL